MIGGHRTRQFDLLARSSIAMMRLMTKLLAILGLYMIVLVRMAGGRSGSNSFTPFLLELAAVTVLFAIATVFLLTRRPRS